MRVTITRSREMPDPVLLARYRRAPELGPRILFFSGGSALRRLCGRLIEYTHNSIHLITPFDSGGSSAALRDAFGIIAVGDIRNRIMALADLSVTGNPAVYRLFSSRLPADADEEELLRQLDDMIKGKDLLVREIPHPLRKIIRNHLRFFWEAMPEGLDLRGASLGNLVLVGGMLNNRQHPDPVIFLFSKLVEARGVVRPVVNRDLTLFAEEEGGALLIGQHNFARSGEGEAAPIKRICLSRNREWLDPVDVEIRNKVRSLILQAELICYPMGSFYSSLLACLLPRGVGRAVMDNDCPKVYIPNTGRDPEQRGMTVGDSVRALLSFLKRDLGNHQPDRAFLDFVILDRRPDSYSMPLDPDELRGMGLEVLVGDLVTEESRPHLDEGRLLEMLLSLT